WWHGMTIAEWHVLILIAAALLLNGVFSLFSGFRQTYSPAEAVSEAITALGLSLLLALALLCLIGEVTFAMAWTGILGKVVIEAMPISLGMSFANSQVRGRSREGEDEDRSPAAPGHDQRGDPETLQLKADLTDL